ncbi:hypothetical protein Btru_077301 [Bulinus truncatus]|nr:hypothetical protein Btru_077301 [Bulinus truncatus]
MAPPGVNSFYDYLDTLSAFGPRYSSLQLSLSSSFVSTMSPPAINVTQLASSSSKPMMKSSDILSILSDHDYVTKPVGWERPTEAPVEKQALYSDGEEEEALEEEETMGADESVGAPTQGTVGDAMLSSAADFSSETDTDFLQELDSIDFTDLDPCSDVAMEDSFQDFIDSVLDRPRPTFFGAEMESDGGGFQQGSHEAVILSKEGFLGALGLKPTAQTSNRAALASNVTSCCFEPFGPITQDNPTPERVPTKQCSSCSSLESVSRIVYSTAGTHSYTTVPALSRSDCSIRPSCFPQSVMGALSQGRLFPLTIDTSFDFEPQLSTRCDSPVRDYNSEEEDKPQVDDDAELLKWLHGGAEESDSVRRTGQLEDVQMDMETFIGLDSYVTESTSPSPQTYIPRDNDPDIGHLKLSFLSADRYGFLNRNFPRTEKCNESSVKSSYNSPSADPLSSGPWSYSGTVSPYSSPSFSDQESSSNESTQLALLNLFSEENASALHSIEESDLRFI